MAESKSAKFDLGHLTSLVALIGAGAICIAIAKQLGFFAVVDLRLLSLMTIEDILSNSLSYVPITIFSAAIGIWVQQSEGELPGSKRIAKFVTSSIPGYDMKANVFVIVCALLFVDNWPFVVLISLVLFYGAVLSWLAAKDTVFPKWLLKEFSYAMYILAVAYVLGAYEGIVGLQTKTLSVCPRIESQADCCSLEALLANVGASIKSQNRCTSQCLSQTDESDSTLFT